MTSSQTQPAIPSEPARRKPSVCWIGMNNYNLLSGRSDIRHVGGAEVQRLRISRELLDRGYAGSFVTLDHGQADGIVHDGIRVFKAYDVNVGLPILRFIHPRWTGLWSAMSRADSDIYIARGADSEAGQAAWWCRRHRRPFIFWCANDTDCMRQPRLLKTWRERHLARLALRSADVIVAQTTAQVQLLREQYGLESLHISNLGIAPSRVSAEPPQPGRPSRILWAGRIAPEKRCDWLLDIARQCPQVEFDLVGPTDRESPYTRQIRDQAASLPNVHLHGEQPYSQMPRFFQQAQALCCTSDAEGFPNTFLEAWSVGLPIVSSFDPDNAIAANGAGVVGSDVGRLCQGIRELLGSAEAWQKAADGARKCAQAHSPRQSVDRLAGILTDLASNGHK